MNGAKGKEGVAPIPVSSPGQKHKTGKFLPSSNRRSLSHATTVPGSNARQSTPNSVRLPQVFSPILFTPHVSDVALQHGLNISSSTSATGSHTTHPNPPSINHPSPHTDQPPQVCGSLHHRFYNTELVTSHLPPPFLQTRQHLWRWPFSPILPQPAYVLSYPLQC
jgi:hypothetical protein